MDYLCVEFGNCRFSRFGLIVPTNTDAAKHLTRATVVNIHCKVMMVVGCCSW